MDLTIVQTPIKSIYLPKVGLKTHSKDHIEQIANSIEKFGFNDPVALDQNNEVIEGAGRVLAAKKLKYKTIPTIILGHLSELQRIAYRIAHNKICLNTGFNLDALKVEMEQISRIDESLLTFTGFGEAELTDLFVVPPLPVLNGELIDFLPTPKEIHCPHCGEIIYA
ncbi:MAG: ParB/Srx family N-terminal domain-containing protein [Vampirovibrionales bacterium]|nr:ParB/Srx family N-terminal domain-containing protein [Vampirovibrionales bacterium]